jgi:hypothetical protein
MPAPAAAILTAVTTVSEGRRGSRPPRAAIEICARDLAVDEADVAVLPRARRREHYKSDIFYIAVRGSEEPRYVVKVDIATYDAEHELRALEFAARILGQTEERAEGGLGVVRPVGCGSDPSFLVTRHQPGVLAQQAIDRAVLRWRGARPIAEAHSHARHMARWIGEFRARGVEAGGGLDAAAYFDELRVRAADCADTGLIAGKAMSLLLGRIEEHLRQLGDEDVARMLRRYPNRGDARPKNFLVGDDGVLYAFDMEGFGFGPMEHDISCLHHTLEYDGVRSPAAARRASAVWGTFWNEYLQHGSSPPFALLGYVYFLLDRMQKSARLAQNAGLARRLRTRVWLHNRLGWLARLSGDLNKDADHMLRNI